MIFARERQQTKTLTVAVFSSGGGGNFQYLVDHQKPDFFDIAALVVDKKCGAIERAQFAEIPCIHLEKSGGSIDYGPLYDDPLVISADVLVLAGYMPIIPPEFIDKVGKIIINTHPSLLPKYGGIGMYGVKVQEAVLKAGEPIAGCSAHYVTPEVDAGDVICQRRLEVRPEETAWGLGGRIFDLEGPNLVDALQSIHTELSGEGK